VNLIVNNYVEPVEPDSIMHGAMRGLAEGLDADSAWLSTEEMAAANKRGAEAKGSVGIELTRQYYLRVVSTRDGSPAAKAGLHTGDFVRVIDDKPTREMSVWAGTRMLRGAPGSSVPLLVLRGNAADPHEVTLTRVASTGTAVTSKKLPGGETYVRVARFTREAPAALKQIAEAAQKDGSSGLVVDLRGTADGAPADGVAAARIFVKSGTIATLAGRDNKTVTMAGPTDGAVTLPTVLLVSNGTANAAEVFASALQGNTRAALVGEPTAGIAAAQRLVKLPDNRALWMTTERYVTSAGTPIHEHGLRPDVGVAEPSVPFGETAPATDEALAKAVEQLKIKK